MRLVSTFRKNKMKIATTTTTTVAIIIIITIIIIIKIIIPYFFTYKPSDFFSFQPKILGDFSVTINNFALGL